MCDFVLHVFSFLQLRRWVKHPEDLSYVWWRECVKSTDHDVFVVYMVANTSPSIVHHTNVQLCAFVKLRWQQKRQKERAWLRRCNPDHDLEPSGTMKSLTLQVSQAMIDQEHALDMSIQLLNSLLCNVCTLLHMVHCRLWCPNNINIHCVMITQWITQCYYYI